jgi:hypothetical protein
MSDSLFDPSSVGDDFADGITPVADRTVVTPVLTPDQIAAIIFNESRALRGGDALDQARTAMAATILNADRLWGANRSHLAGTSSISLPATLTPAEQADLKDIQGSVRRAQELQAQGQDPAAGATNYNFRAFRSETPPDWGRDFSSQAIHGPFYDPYERLNKYLNIWHNPAAVGASRSRGSP